MTKAVITLGILLVASQLFAGGQVKNSKEAIRIAYPAMVKMYGESTVKKFRPYCAKLKKGVWHVYGTLPANMVGGTPEVEISAISGEILDVSHGK